jgi:hypothetical protein
MKMEIKEVDTEDLISEAAEEWITNFSIRMASRVEVDSNDLPESITNFNLFRSLRFRIRI